ncbi:protein APEM9-like isoform X3 [Miscanthus floridulus]|uniref:protein APEM9-like isoform X3 n=1 Tax=Miscanthus floridulus TaxID=154761 RepID=UPI0034581703
MFGSVPSVPARVFLTGATIQMAAGSVCDLRPIFEEYLTNWRYTNDEVYVLDGEHGSTSNGFVVTSVMSTGQYFQLAELYTVTFICIVSHDSETAISWAEKADLTEQSRQLRILLLMTPFSCFRKELTSPVPSSGKEPMDFLHVNRPRVGAR